MLFENNSNYKLKFQTEKQIFFSAKPTHILKCLKNQLLLNNFFRVKFSYTNLGKKCIKNLTAASRYDKTGWRWILWLGTNGKCLFGLSSNLACKISCGTFRLKSIKTTQPTILAKSTFWYILIGIFLLYMNP
jgi:hypothetical protein